MSCLHVNRWRRRSGFRKELYSWHVVDANTSIHGYHDSLYLPNQERSYRKHFEMWLAKQGNVEAYQTNFRNLNMESSLAVFCGDYLSENVIQEISDKVNVFAMGLFSLDVGVSFLVPAWHPCTL